MSRKKNEHFSGYFDVTKIIDNCIEKETTNFYITKVVYRNPAVIVFWSDGTKTVAKCHGEDTFDYKVGLLTAVLKKFRITRVGKLIEDWKPKEESSTITVHDVRERNKE
jgi:hypothetical protein